MTTETIIRTKERFEDGELLEPEDPPIAELADCTENAAKVNFHYAVKRLKELLR